MNFSEFIFGARREKASTFTEVREFLSNVDAINQGGCGISALAMYRWLKQHNQLPKHTHFLFLENDESTHKNNCECLKNKAGELKACGHVALVLNDEVIDCEKDVNLFRYEYRLKVESEDVLIKTINNVSSWNVAFDRREETPIIAHCLGISLSDVKLR